MKRLSLIFIFTAGLTTGCSNQLRDQDGNVHFHGSIVEVMQRINVLVYERQATDEQVDSLRHRHASQLGAELSLLADNLQGMQSQMPGVENYAGYVLDLRNHAATLDRGQVSRATLNNIQNTCDGCHQQYRAW